MGTFFTNFQVYRGRRSRRVTERDLLAAFRIYVGGGLVECKKDEDADRTVIVASADDSPWAAVYDEATEDQDLDHLNRVARGLSTSMGAPVASVLVHDNHALRMAAFTGGQRFASFARDGSRFRGNAESWGRWLPGTDVDARSIHRVWKEPAPNAVEKLESIASLFGMDSTLVSSGYTYFTQEPLAELQSLRLRHADLPPAKVARALSNERAPTLVDMQAWSTIKPYDKKRVMVELSISATNVGGRFPGLDVGVEGTALRLFASSGGCLSSGHGTQLQLCPIKFRPSPRQPEALRTSSKSFVLEHRLSLLFWAICRPGEGTLRISLTPRANPDGGARSPEIRLRTSRV